MNQRSRYSGNGIALRVGTILKTQVSVLGRGGLAIIKSLRGSGPVLKLDEATLLAVRKIDDFDDDGPVVSASF